MTLILTGLGAHDSINLGMHVAQLASIDPNRDGDLFRIYLDGDEILQVGLGFGNVQS
ncbi:MAG: hypothetical protein H6926_07075 [Chromatiales bacterium]|nr:hypothetical protein [Chromatiales bacterium]